MVTFLEEAQAWGTIQDVCPKKKQFPRDTTLRNTTISQEWLLFCHVKTVQDEDGKKIEQKGRVQWVGHTNSII
jgi:hypothetical protein